MNMIKSKYCGRCGRQLNQDILAKYYNVDTGEAYYHYRYICPDKRWYNGHTDFKTDQYGDSYAYQS